MSFEDYIDAYKNLLFKIASVYCYDREERKDLVQDIIIQLWKAYPKYDSQYKLSTWTYRIALNVCISYVRKTTVRQKAINQYKEFVEIEMIEESDDDEHLNKLNRAMEVLNPIERAVIMLNLDGCSNKEIAQVMGISASNVSTRILRIKTKLKKELNR